MESWLYSLQHTDAQVLLQRSQDSVEAWSVWLDLKIWKVFSNLHNFMTFWSWQRWLGKIRSQFFQLFLSNYQELFDRCYRELGMSKCMVKYSSIFWKPVVLLRLLSKPLNHQFYKPYMISSANRHYNKILLSTFTTITGLQEKAWFSLVPDLSLPLLSSSDEMQVVQRKK